MRILMWFAVGFAAAAVFGGYVLPVKALLWAIVFCAVIFIASLILVHRWRKCRLVALIMLGCALSFSWQAVFDGWYLSVPREADGISQELTVYATDYSRETDYGVSADGFIVLNDRFYRVTAYLPEETKLSPGDSIRGYFTLGATLPGCSKDSDYSRSNGIFLNAKTDYVTTEPADKVPWFGYPAVVQRYITNMIEAVFPSDVTAFARALLLGDTDTLDYETDTAFKISGIRHIIAVSGLHVSILFSLVFLLTGKRNWLATLLGLPVLFFFAALAGFSPSITRACIMHALMSLALLFRKEYDPASALSFAVFMMLLVNPWTICHVGFQLSVGCIIGILLFAEPIRNWLMDDKRLGRGKGLVKKTANWLSTAVSVSVGATIVTAPLCAMYFGMVSLVGVLTNLLTLWAVTVAFYCIVLTCVVGVFSAAMASVFAWVTAWPLRYVLVIVRALSSFPLAAVYTDSVYIIMWLVLSYVLLAVYLVMKHKRPLMSACCSVIFLCVALFVSWTEPLTDECRVTVLDVGQGQCILLQSEGKSYLVDCGGDSDTTSADIAAATLLSQGITRLDGLILTHYDADHAAGAMYLLSRVPADRLYLPTTPDPDGHDMALRSYDAGLIQMVTEDMTITYGDSCITLVPSQNAATDNESGLCILFQTENCDILITGDRSSAGELELMQHMALPELEVLIVGHHGSKYSTSEELLAATTPQYAIISVSADNTYGHPTQEVLERLEKYGCMIYRTDLDGTVIYRG